MAPPAGGSSPRAEANAVPLMTHLRGHTLTVGRRLAWSLRPEAPPESAPWSTELVDPVVGLIRLTGRLTEPAGARAVLVVIHGLGGSADSSYAVGAARVAAAAGLACLRLNLRGADRLGEDYYHAGLTADLAAAVASGALARYPSILVLGFSLGGHLALRWAAEGAPGAGARARGVAAVCAPLDLAAGGRRMDRPEFWLYRRYLFASLIEIYRAVARRRPVPIPVDDAAAIRRFREWDTRVVAARHGFRDADDYHARVSVAPLLERLAVPALLVEAEGDPMVPASTVRPILEGRRTSLEVAWVPGGHIAFPRGAGLRLGEPAERRPETRLIAQVVAWLRRRADAGAIVL